jgi:hypothetical protein
MPDETPTTPTPAAGDAAAPAQASAPAATPSTTAEAQTVPYERFAAKVAEVAELKTIAASVGELQGQFQALQTEVAKERSTWGEKETLYKAGIVDPDVGEVVRFQYERSGSGDFADFVSKADQDPVLKKLLSNAKPVGISPSENMGARNSPPPRGEFSPESVQSMSVDEIKANYAKFAGAWGIPATRFK